MCTIPVFHWIANAAARFSGAHGAVSSQARRADCSRQSIYDQARKVHIAVEAEYAHGPTREHLIRENQVLRDENAQLWDWVDRAVEFPPKACQRFAATAMAMGLSLTQIRALLVLILGPRQAPSRSTIGRWVQAAGEAAGQVLKRLDVACRALVRVGCLDEIFFHGRPVLVGVEPASMVWFIGERAHVLRGSIWAERLRPWDALQHVVADAGLALQAGIAKAQEYRRQDGRDPLASTLDVFHTKHGARRALTIAWNHVERACKAFDQAEARVRKIQRQGTDSRSASLKAVRAWDEVVKRFHSYEAVEVAWDQAKVALEIFGPDGRLNDRKGAEAQIRLALPHLVGRHWRRVRNHLLTPESFTFLDRMHAELALIPIDEGLRDALVRLWWLRRQRVSITGPIVGAGHVTHLVWQEYCRKLDPDWRRWYGHVAAVLRATVCASSAVECMNSVLRMHQSRHRSLTQEMLDLKRLYWNCRRFGRGKRKGKSPYEHLGLEFQGNDFWRLIQPKLPTAIDRAKAQAKAKLGVRMAAM